MGITRYFDASQARWKLGVKAGQTSQAWKKSVARCKVLCGSRKTIKLNEEPNTIQLHASALRHVVNFKQRTSITLCRIIYNL
uniref:Uncharacterized protein n=1 Tax=Helianthus annuus TaxID=4232 RepID=A0A251SEH7_HELAN